MDAMMRLLGMPAEDLAATRAAVASLRERLNARAAAQVALWAAVAVAASDADRAAATNGVSAVTGSAGGAAASGSGRAAASDGDGAAGNVRSGTP